MSAAREIRLPALSATMEEATLIQWLVRAGDEIREGQPIAEVSTDKVDMEMEAPFAGTILELAVPDGTVIPLGAVMAMVETDAVDLLGDLGLDHAGSGNLEPGHEAAAVADRLPDSVSDADGARADSGPSLVGVDTPEPSTTGSQSASRIVAASPPARKLAARLGVDLAVVTATGVRGQVTPTDVHRHADAARNGSAVLAPAESAPPPAPVQPHQPDADRGESRQDSVRRATASIMTKSFTIPQFTLYRQLRLDAAASLKGGESWTTIVVRALAAGLREHPELNAQWSEDAAGVASFEAVRIGIAVDRPGAGLVVTTVAEPDSMPLDAADHAVRNAIDRARTGRLRPDDLAQASVTVSNLGGMGVEFFNALLFPPQAAILSIGSIAMRPVATADGALKAALTCTVGLTVDHRVADGADGARYLETVAASIERRA